MLCYLLCNLSIEALEDADKSLSLSGKNMRAHMRRGIAIYELDRLAAAMQSFNNAKKIDGKFQHFSLNL